MTVSYEIRIPAALARLEAAWVSKDPEREGRFSSGQWQEVNRNDAPGRVIFEWLSEAIDRSDRAAFQGQGDNGVRVVTMRAHLWGESLEDAEDMYLAFSAIGASALNPNYFSVISADWETGNALHTARGSVGHVLFQLKLPLMRLPERFARVQQIPIKQTVEPPQ